MAVTPLIAMSGRAPTPDKTFSNVLLNLGRIEDIKTAQARAEVTEAEAPIRQRLLEAQTTTAEAAVPSEQERFNQRNREKVASVANISRVILPDLQAGNIESVTQKLQQRAQELSAANIPNKNTLAAIELAQKDPQQLMQASVAAIREDEIVNPRKQATGLASAKTEVLESGATIQALPSGEVKVKNPLGIEVTGQDRLDVLREAREQEQKKIQERADVTVSTERRVQQVKAASKTADKAFGMVEKIRQNITNLREVTPLIGQGATTGPIVSLFPSIKAETIKLEQLQRRLGLDVVGATTFGALSKGELDLAKSVALPLGLEGDALIQWTNDTIAAKEKLANYYEEQALFLGQGNTQRDWLKHKRAELKRIMGGATEADIRQTMKANNMTRPQVLQELKRRNLSGGT